MILRITLVAALALLVACSTPVVGQEKLGDLIVDGGQEWIIGRWVATTDQGQKVEMNYTWGLDRHIVLTSFRMGDARHEGIVMFASARQEVLGAGADNRGGVTEGTWSEEWDGLVYRMKHTGTDGETHKGEMVHSKRGADGMVVAMYGLDSSGYRSQEPWAKLEYKRQAKGAKVEAASEDRGRSGSDYQSLGDLVSEGGYEWLMGKWKGVGDGQEIEVEYKAVLGRNAAVVTARMGAFKYHGLITYKPYGQEIAQIGADNMGGVWTGSWDQGYDGAVNRLEGTNSDGSVQRMEHVYVKTNNDEFKVKEYAVEAGGYRAFEPRGTMTFKRQK